MEFSSAALCREKQEGGHANTHTHVHTVDQNCSELCSSAPTTS